MADVEFFYIKKKLHRCLWGVERKGGHLLYGSWSIRRGWICSWNFQINWNEVVTSIRSSAHVLVLCGSFNSDFHKFALLCEPVALVQWKLTHPWFQNTTNYFFYAISQTLRDIKVHNTVCCSPIWMQLKHHESTKTLRSFRYVYLMSVIRIWNCSTNLKLNNKIEEYDTLRLTHRNIKHLLK